jgi:CheY-like chemotaxis protein
VSAERNPLDGPSHSGQQSPARTPPTRAPHRDDMKGHETGAADRSSTDESLKVLVVDDNADALLLLALRLRRLGHDVRQARDGLSAVDTAAEFQPDVVLMDLSMPGLDGYTTAQRLRAQESERTRAQERERAQGRTAMIIALTGYEDDDTRGRADAAGFDHYVVKPIDGEHLRSLLETRRKARQ